MAPIINPLWFYLIGISENVACTFWVVGGLILTASVILGVMLMCDAWDIDVQLLKVFKKTIIIGGLLITVGNLIPSKDTCYKMMTAALVTPNNIAVVGEAATDVVDYIIDSVDQLLEENDKESE